MICPSSDDWKRFDLGQIEPRIQAEWSAHLDGCAACAQLLEVIDEESDPLLADLRRVPFREEFSDPEVRELLERAAETPNRSNQAWATADSSNLEILRIRPAAGRLRESADFPEIAGYRLTSLLGRGGMGLVYLAEHLALKREVAVKTLRGGHLADEDLIVRFRREAEAAAALDHPSIVPVFEVGQRLHYFSMAYIEGVNLEQRAHADPLTARQSASIVKQLADAIQYAHERGVVHRDLKPENVLLDIAGSPHITDFGLARRIEVEDRLTHTGQVMGTLGYMSPEQAQGQRDTGAASDIYSLGAILYRLVVGRPPFGTGSLMDALQMIISAEPSRPRSLCPSLDRDIETICLKCLSKRPSQRYLTAAELSADLQRYLNRESILARPAGRRERAWRWCRRNPRVATLTAAIALLLIMVAAGSSVAAVLLARMAHREQLAAQAALSAQGRAEGAERDARQETRLKEEALRRALSAEQDERDAARRAREESERARTEAATTQQVVQFLTGLFTESNPLALEGLGARKVDAVGAPLAVKELLQRAQRRLDEGLRSDPKVRASILDSVGNVYRGLAMFPEAEPLLEEALSLRRDEHGPESREAAASLLHLGMLRQAQARYDEAARLYDQALQIRVSLYGQESLEAADVRFSMAWLEAERASLDQNLKPRLRAATQLMSEVLRTRRSILGDKHRQVAVAQIALSWMQFADDQQYMAMINAAQALGTLESESGSPQLAANILLYLQLSKARKDDKPKAMQIARQVLGAAQRLLGEDHLMVGLLLGDMAGLATEMQDDAEAERLIRRALDIGRKLPGGHPRMVEALLKLGDAVRNRGDLEEAKALYEEALKLGLRHFGPTHRTLLQIQSRLDGLSKPE